MMPYIMSEYDIGATEASSLAASYFYAYILAQIPASLLIDRIGHRVMITGAILLCALGSLVFGVGQTLEAAYVGRFIAGLGASFATINCIKLIAKWFPSSRFMRIAGVMLMIGMLGAVAGQAPLAKVMQILGERKVFENFSTVGICLAAVFWVLVRDHRDPTLDHPHRKGRTIHYRTLVKSVIHSKESWIIAVYSGLGFTSIAAFGGLWGCSFLISAYRYTEVEAAHLVSLVFLGIALGTPLLGWFADKIKKRKRVMCMGGASGSVLSILILYVPSIPHPILGGLLFLFGVSLSSFFLAFTIMRENHKAFVIPVSIGFIYTFDALFGAFTDVFMGWLLDLRWSGEVIDRSRIFFASDFRWAMSLLPILLMISLICLQFIKDVYRKEQKAPETFP